MIQMKSERAEGKIRLNSVKVVQKVLVFEVDWEKQEKY